MRRLIFHLSIFLFALAVGISGTSLFQRAARIALADVRSTHRPAPSVHMGSVLPTDNVRILIKGSAMSGCMLKADLEVLNGGRESIYYRGYTEADHQSWRILSNGRFQRITPFCSSGLGEFELMPGEQRQLKVTFKPEGRVVQVGLDFRVGEGRIGPEETIWSEEISAALLPERCLTKP